MTTAQFLRKCRRMTDDGACDDSQLKAVCAFLAESLYPDDDRTLVETVLDELQDAVETVRGWLPGAVGPTEMDVCDVCGAEVPDAELDEAGVCRTCQKENDDGDD